MEEVYRPDRREGFESTSVGICEYSRVLSFARGVGREE